MYCGGCVSLSLLYVCEDLCFVCCLCFSLSLSVCGERDFSSDSPKLPLNTRNIYETYAAEEVVKWLHSQFKIQTVSEANQNNCKQI